MSQKMLVLTFDHQSILLNMFNLWNYEGDVLDILTKDGKKMSLKTKLIAFYAPSLFSMLKEDLEKQNPTLIVNETEKTLLVLLDLLKYGKATSDDKAIVLEVMEAAGSLGISINNISYTAQVKDEDVEESSSNMSTESFLQGFDELMGNNVDARDLTATDLNFSSNMSKESFIERFDKLLDSNSEKLEVLKNVSSEQTETTVEVSNESTAAETACDDFLHYKCESCGKTFTTKNKLSRHSLCHTSFRCNSCQKGFRMISMLRRHMTTQHGEKKHEESSSSDNDTLNEQVEGSTISESLLDDSGLNVADFECETCGKSFKSKVKLSRHSLCHTNYKCHICFKGFRMSSMLQRHTSTMHRVQVQCDLCEKKFTSSSLLRKHTLNRHSIVHAKNALSSENLLGLKPVLV